MSHLIYLRVSTDQQDVQTQEDHCRQLIKHQDAKVFSDPDVSSRVPMKDRQGLQDMLSHLKPGMTVVVYKLDRLSRDVIEMVTIYRMIKQKKCYLLSCSDSNCDNEFMMGLMGVLAQKERSDISERTKAKLASKKSRGERVGTVPFGYDLADDKVKLIPNPKEQEYISLMCELFEEGSSYQDITDHLNQLGYRNREGNPFQKMSVYRILRRLETTRSSYRLQPFEDTHRSVAQV